MGPCAGIPRARALGVVALVATVCAVSALAWWVEAQGKWSEVARMPTARGSLAAGVVDGKLYALGGSDDEDNTLDTVEVYDPATDRWDAVAPMPTARCGLAAGVVDGKLYAVGGSSGPSGKCYSLPGVLATVERYDPATHRWTALAPMPTARFDLAVVVSNNMLYALGGSDDHNTLDTVERYDPITGKWWTAGSLSTARRGHSAVELLDDIYVLGGFKGNGFSVDTVDRRLGEEGLRKGLPKEGLRNVFRDTDLVPYPKRYLEGTLHLAAGVLTYPGSIDDGKIYCVGTGPRGVAVLDPWSSGVRPASSTLGTWGGLGGRVAPIPTRRYDTGSRGGLAVGVVDNKLYALGGYGEDEGNTLDTVEVYDPPFLRTNSDTVIIILAAAGGVVLLASLAAAAIYRMAQMTTTASKYAPVGADDAPQQQHINYGSTVSAEVRKLMLENPNLTEDQAKLLVTHERDTEEIKSDENAV